MNLNLNPLFAAILSRVESFSLGVPVAFVMSGYSPAEISIPRRGALILFTMGESTPERWDGESPLSCIVHILHQEVSRAPSAGEIQESIREGLTSIPYLLGEAGNVIAKFVKHVHVDFTPATESEKGFDTHASNFELVLNRSKDAPSSEAKED